MDTLKVFVRDKEIAEAKMMPLDVDDELAACTSSLLWQYYMKRGDSYYFRSAFGRLRIDDINLPKIPYGTLLNIEYESLK